jgi:hypothetical protein
MRDLDSCLPRMVNQLELDAKTWKQGLTLRCFFAKLTLSQKPCMSRSWLNIYHSSGKPGWVLACSVLLVVLFLGETFEDMVASLAWPCILPPSWLVEWDAFSANDDNG